MDEINELQASPQQKKMFFALCNQLGWNHEEVKERIKKKYHLDSFANISKVQLTETIDAMNNKVLNKLSKPLIAFFEMHLALQKEGGDINYSTKNFPKHLATQLLRFFVVKEKRS